MILPVWPKRFILVFLCGNPEHFLRYEITLDTTIEKILRDTVPKLNIRKKNTVLGKILELFANKFSVGPIDRLVTRSGIQITDVSALDHNLVVIATSKFQKIGKLVLFYT